ncbi:hypothetical protein TWF106_008879 [Orbilia oligospora]|uniref:Uncharacterized protein n=1 Tax=Orbilia oligospora TaxID=2813651 RepID=A0A6G1LWK4_ORBOL|nr:hypothetical protein TWF788_001049 [Orbilia oligospora]KAF3203082.1 hypothetical protein TWF679_010545 [Orbilia oligospora]KAF3207033.1 hypothetical protein TWF191_001140 [Orbilia oligospora]KAF3215038.1 hypothetical protein TWF106_008879 [Orbilia oligospora]KAF3235809.1 hypothetical protein TWF192_000625 [Orbilia oligospora]
MSEHSGAKRRRSTTSVFADLNPPTNDQTPLRSKLYPREIDSVLSREVQQDALELTGLSDDSETQEQAELTEILAQGDWAESEVALFRRLRRRGREALLPAPWRLDFTTFPETLYSPVGEQSFICALTPSASMEFRGSQALQRLVNVGGQVRDRTEINPSAPVEPLIFQEIKNFLTWAEKDGEISLSSVLTINYNRSKNGNAKVTSEKTERKMKSMASELRVKNQQAPHQTAPPSNDIENIDTPARPLAVIYGITVYNCVAALSSLGCDSSDTDVKTHVVLDWTDTGLDIWNAIAVAIFIVSCRNDVLDSDEGARLKLIQRADDDA